MGSECPEWTVASSDLVFIGMQSNGQWSVMWGVVGTDLVVEVIAVGLFHSEREKENIFRHLFCAAEAAERNFLTPPLDLFFPPLARNIPVTSHL